MRCVVRMSSDGVSRKPFGSRAAGPVFLFDLAMTGSPPRLQRSRRGQTPRLQPLDITKRMREGSAPVCEATPSAFCGAYSRASPWGKARTVAGSGAEVLGPQLDRRAVRGAVRRGIPSLAIADQRLGRRHVLGGKQPLQGCEPVRIV